ncbi:MAG: hypothetical protein J7M08_01080 [Planctomycetes bacterium]|nr:hypothetical protein [Planctomycetota bacterium]
MPKKFFLSGFVKGQLRWAMLPAMEGEAGAFEMAGREIELSREVARQPADAI